MQMRTYDHTCDVRRRVPHYVRCKMVEITDFIPVITEYRDDAGFVHPGVGVSADMLRTMQRHARAHDEPWLPSMEKLSSHPRASADAGMSCKPESDEFIHIPFGDGGLAVAHCAQRDGDTASKQAIMYVITGDARYRENCMRILRAWMCARDAALHRDQQIRWGIALYHLCFAADIMRTTSSPDASLSWTPDDDERFRSFLNVVEFTVDGWWYFMNQHSYALKGWMAKTIFCGEREKYDIAVERATVHKAYEPHNRGRSGSIKYQIASITEDIETGEVVDPPFIEVTEVGRDQAHAYGNIGSLSEIAMTMYVQGTRVDPETGEASEDEGAVGAFEFLSDRLLAGADYIARFNLGYKTRYYRTYFDAPNSWNKRNFGRVDPVFGILYHYYKYHARRDVHALAPYMCEMYEKFSSPESSLEEFIGYSELLYSTDEAVHDHIVPQTMRDRSDGVYMCADITAVREGGVSVCSDGGRRFLRMRGDSEAADRTFGHPALADAELVYRADGECTLSLSKCDKSNVLARVTLRDTHGKWETTSFRFEGNGEDSTILYYTKEGHGTVDLYTLKLLSEAER